jgi:hypothetical protein
MTEQPDQPFKDPQDEQPWRRQPGEPQSWHLRFMRFCRMGFGRSLLGLYNQERSERGLKPKLQVSGSFEKRVVEFDWRSRAAAWDMHRERQDRTAWEKRRREWRNHEVEYAKALLKKAELMLQFPLAVTEQSVTQEGGKTIITNVINPCRWSIRDAASMIETADRLYRLALEMETNRSVTDIQIETDIEEIRRKRWEEIKDMLPSILNSQDESNQLELQPQADQSLNTES